MAGHGSNRKKGSAEQSFLVNWLFILTLVAIPSWVGGQELDLHTVPQPARELDNKFGFKVLIWQYRNDAKKDAPLYRQINISGFHIDYGRGKSSRASWAKEQGWPYYVDHAAGKGILHLTPRSGLNKIAKDGSPSIRPWSYFDPATQKELGTRLTRNIPPVANGPVLAIALDDEVSIGTFNSPLELDYSQHSMQAFRNWLPSQYVNEAALLASWKLKPGEPPKPQTYEDVRKELTTRPPSRWRLARWIDFRSFMDESQAAMFASLVRHANQLAPGVPVGVVGAQQPSAYGGFDYAKLKNALQWTEAYDIGGTNEILHSFWSSTPRRGRMQTYFLSGNIRQDKWFLWYYLAHGNRGVIAWPDLKGQPWFENGKIQPYLKQLASTFSAVQQDALGVLSHPDTQPLFSPIAILYSHPSVQLGWAIDASAHGKTWPRRSSSLDNACLSSGKNRVAWTRLLEDLGYQARFVDTTELCNGFLNNKSFKVLVLPQAFALSKSECAAIAKFVEGGGRVIADYGTAITDEHGNGYAKSPLDSIFGIDRSVDKGWFDGKRRFEIDGEAYQRPLIERFAKSGVLQDKGMTVIERGLSATQLVGRFGNGRTMFLNASPTPYFDLETRAGAFGKKWRSLLRKWLMKHSVSPEVKLIQETAVDFGVELLRYRQKNGKEIWAITCNPTRQAAIDGAGNGLRLPKGQIELKLVPRRGVSKLKNLRTGEMVGTNIKMPADEAVFLEVTFQSN